MAQALADSLDQARTAWAEDPNNMNRKAVYEAVKAELATVELAGSLDQARTAWAHDPANDSLKEVYEAVRADVRLRAALALQLAGTHVHQLCTSSCLCSTKSYPACAAPTFAVVSLRIPESGACVRAGLQVDTC
jgi:hypothetical protein